MIARSMADAIADLLAVPRPVLFLDTCDVVNLIQVGTTVPVGELRAATRLLAALAANPQRCQLVVTYVTGTEYSQKTDPANPVYVQDSTTVKLPPRGYGCLSHGTRRAYRKYTPNPSAVGSTPCGTRDRLLESEPRAEPESGRRPGLGPLLGVAA